MTLSERYGPAILALPPASGFSLSAYLVPLAVAIGLLLLGIVLLIPFVAWYLGVSLWAALMMDISIVAFYLIYAFVFNIAYDRVFPLPRPGAHDRTVTRALPA